MSIFRGQNLMVATDTAIVAGGLDVNTTNIGTAGQLAFVGITNQTVAPGVTVADTDVLTIFEYISGTTSLKRTMTIPGRKVTKFTGETYSPATRRVIAIGYNRKTAVGSIPVNASTEYQFTIHVISDKQTYSERNLLITMEFISSATATQSTIATQIVNAINTPTNNSASAYLPKLLTAVKVGDGTGAYGLTGATNFGVEITGKVLAQAVGSYAIETPNFAVELNSLSGFGQGAVSTNISNPYQSGGSYQWTYNLENFLLGQEGKMNRVIFPIPVDYLQTSSTPTISAQVAGSGNVGVTNGSDLVTFATTNASFAPGDLITYTDGTAAVFNGEIKYLIGTTQAVLVDLVTGTTQANSVVKKRGFYSTIVIEFTNPNLFDGVGVTGNNNQSVIIAVPAWTAAAAYSSPSTAALSILSLLNPYMNSLGFASVTI
jgi:hypothetical protein